MGDVIPFPVKLIPSKMSYFHLLDTIYHLSAKFEKNNYAIEDVKLGITLYKEVYDRTNSPDTKYHCIYNIIMLESILYGSSPEPHKPSG